VGWDGFEDDAFRHLPGDSHKRLFFAIRHVAAANIDRAVEQVRREVNPQADLLLDFRLHHGNDGVSGLMLLPAVGVALPNRLRGALLPVYCQVVTAGEFVVHGYGLAACAAQAAGDDDVSLRRRVEGIG